MQFSVTAGQCQHQFVVFLLFCADQILAIADDKSLQEIGRFLSINVRVAYQKDAGTDERIDLQVFGHVDKSAGQHVNADAFVNLLNSGFYNCGALHDL